jgi:hypothetical protein
MGLLMWLSKDETSFKFSPNILAAKRERQMTRRLKKAENTLLGFVIVVALIGWAISKTLDATGLVVPVVIFSVLVLGIVWYKHDQRQKRIVYLRTKYGDERVVEWILQRRFWQGQTSQQLMDSLGNPRGIDRKSMATRKREVWKYNPRGVNRFGLRITLDNDIVANWDQKQ